MFSLRNRVCVICAIVSVLLSIDAFFTQTFNVDEDLIFRLYTPANPVDYEKLKTSGLPPISSTSFDPRIPTRIFVHGFKSKEKTIGRYRDAFSTIGNYNFIGVDWIKGASTYNYLHSKGLVPLIAAKLANLLNTLVAEHGLNLQDVTIIGHSLGAHIAGQAAKLLNSTDKIGCIIGLDPAGFGFDSNHPESRLDKSDAEYVQVIHTDGNKFGMIDPIGHADFYPNFGIDQKGCPVKNMIAVWLDKCSHVRAHHLYLESLTTNFTAIRCGSFEEIQLKLCWSKINNAVLMGGDITKDTQKPYGSAFYLETNGDPPFAISNYRSFNRSLIFDLYNVF